MPKKAKIFDHPISTAIQKSEYDRFQKIKDKTGLRPARLLRSFCTTSIPEITFPKQFWDVTGISYVLEKNYTKADLVGMVAQTLGFEWTNNDYIIINNEAQQVDPHKPLNMAEIVRVIQSFYELTAQNKSEK